MKKVIFVAISLFALNANALICQNENTYVAFAPIGTPNQTPAQAAVTDHGISGYVSCVTDSTANFHVTATCDGVLSKAKTGFAYNPVEVKLSFSTVSLAAQASIASTFPDGKTPGPFTDLKCDGPFNAPSNDPPLCGYAKYMCHGNCVSYWMACD